MTASQDPPPPATPRDVIAWMERRTGRPFTAPEDAPPGRPLRWEEAKELAVLLGGLAVRRAPPGRKPGG